MTDSQPRESFARKRELTWEKKHLKVQYEEPNASGALSKQTKYMEEQMEQGRIVKRAGVAAPRQSPSLGV